MSQLLSALQSGKGEQMIIDTDCINYFEGTTVTLLAAVNKDDVEIKAYSSWSEYSLDPKYPASIDLPLIPVGFPDNEDL